MVKLRFNGKSPLDIRTEITDVIVDRMSDYKPEDYMRRLGICYELPLVFLIDAYPLIIDKDFPAVDRLKVISRSVVDVPPQELQGKITVESVRRYFLVDKELREGQYSYIAKLPGYEEWAAYIVILLAALMGTDDDTEMILADTHAVAAFMKDRQATYQQVLDALPQISESTPLIQGTL